MRSQSIQLICDRRCGTLFIRAYKDKVILVMIFMQEQSKLLYEPMEIHLWIAPKGRTDIFKNNVKKVRLKEFTIGYVDSRTGILFSDDKYEDDNNFIRLEFL